MTNFYPLRFYHCKHESTLSLTSALHVFLHGLIHGEIDKYGSSVIQVSLVYFCFDLLRSKYKPQHCILRHSLPTVRCFTSVHVKAAGIITVLYVVIFLFLFSRWEILWHDLLFYTKFRIS